MNPSHGTGYFSDISWQILKWPLPVVACRGMEWCFTWCLGSSPSHGCGVPGSAWETPHKTGLRSPASPGSQTSPFRQVLKAPISTLSSLITAGLGTYIILEASLVIASDRESFSLFSLRAEILHFLLRIGQHPPPPAQQHDARGHGSTGTWHMV